MSPESHLLGRARFDLEALSREHPPRPAHPSKKLLFSLSGAAPRGQLVVARYRAMPLPEAFPRGITPAVLAAADAFSYEPEPPGTLGFHLNFANQQLFCAYGGAAFAQDEQQVAEHPSLASLREALLAAPQPGLAPVTREGGEATPVVIVGAPRTCAIATDADLEADRIYGLYGRAFARASERAVRAAVTRLEPPTLTNVLAIEAPPGGSGPYRMADLRDALITACTGFSAAAAEARWLAGPGPAPRVRIHTGHWGTGAYGGDRVVMALLQMLAARLAGIDELAFHAFDDEGLEAARRAEQLASSLAPPASPVALTLDRVLSLGFRWGPSDGN